MVPNPITVAWGCLSQELWHLSSLGSPWSMPSLSWYVSKVTSTPHHTHTHTNKNAHMLSDKRVQQSGDFEKQFYSLTYPLITPRHPTPPQLHVCFFESFTSVPSSTVFHSVKIEAIILPNAYLPALYAPSCTRRLLHDEVADMFHTHHPLPYVHWMRLSLRNLY